MAGIFPVVLRPGRPVLPKCGEVVDHNPWTIQCAVSKGITVISFLKERDLSARSAALSMEDTCTSVNPKYSEKSKKFSSMLIMSVFPNLCILVKSVTFKNSRHFYLAVSKLEHKLKALVDAHSDWRKNAITFTNRYIEAGLRDRALTRDLEWGIKVPKEGYENKTIYIWAENVLGYFSASETAAREAGAIFPHCGIRMLRIPSTITCTGRTRFLFTPSSCPHSYWHTAGDGVCRTESYPVNT